jgi:ABC-type branched-subunit amino acid transport system substrate-binding protein
MGFGSEIRRRATFVMVVVTLVGTTLLATSGPAGAQSTRGFDGTTVTVAGLGIKSQLGGAETGAQARIERFNDSNELKGVKIEFAEFADDKQEPSTALAEARRLVTQVGVFALVADVSANNPGDYFAQQKVPYFGGGFDATYCSSKPSTALWGYSVSGCAIPSAPSFVNDSKRAMYRYVSEKTGKERPTLALVANDNESGKNTIRINGIAATGAGFRVVLQSANRPTQVSDFTPFVQQILNADDGSQPDAVFCLGAVDCLGLYQALEPAGWEGSYFTGLYSDLLVKPLEGALVNALTVNLNETTPGITQMKKDLDAYQAGLSSKVDLATVYGYTSSDMFIQALKKAAAKGKSNITPENVQKVASTMKWSIDGLIGPVQYPKSTVMTFPACSGTSLSNGDAWVTTEPYTCSPKTYRPNLKVG